MNVLKPHRPFFILICFAAVLFLSDIWVYREFVRAESYFALGAKLMIEEGNWLTPHAPDELPLNKPPLTYWLIAISYKLFGVNYGAARVPSALAALATLALVYFLGNRLSDRRDGLVAAAVLGTSYLFMNFARVAMSDMLLTFFVTASLSSFIVVLRSPEVGSRRFVYLGYAALALGVLTKGPVAIAIVVLPVICELLISRRREDLKKLQIVRGLTLLVVIAAPYFFLVYLRLGAAPLQFFFVGENLKRFTGQVYGASGRPIWYELAAFFSDFAPWSWLVPVAAWIDWKERRENPAVQSRRFLYPWLASALLLFSASSFKLDYYLLPIMPAAALISAPVISPGKNNSLAITRLVKICLALTAFALVLVSFGSLRAGEMLGVNGWLRLLPLLVAGLAMASIAYCVIRRSVFVTALVLCGCIAVAMLSLEITLLPAFTRFLPTKALVSAIPNRRAWFTASKSNDWANDVAFNLPAGYVVQRLPEKAEKVLEVFRNNPAAVVLMSELEFKTLPTGELNLRILTEAETFGHGGLNVRMLRQPPRGRLLVIGRER